MTRNMEYLDDREFEELKKVFYTQAYEIMDDLQDSVLMLEAEPDNVDALQAVKRYVHTLKGDSNSFGLTAVGTLCHRIEDMLPSLLDGKGHVEHDAVDLLLNSLDAVNKLLEEGERGAESGDIKHIIAKIDSFLNGRGNPVSVAGPLTPEHTEYQQLRIRNALEAGIQLYEAEAVFHPLCGERSVAALMVVQKLNGMGQLIRSVPDTEGGDIDRSDRITFFFSSGYSVEELRKTLFIPGITHEITVSVWNGAPGLQDTSHGLHGTGNAAEAPGTAPKSAAASQQNDKSEMLRVEASKVDNLMNLAGELIIAHSMIEQIAKDAASDTVRTDIAARLFSAHGYMERTVSDMQKGIMKMRMVPINHLFRRFPKVVRELSAEKGKLVRLDISGRETELDKGIVDSLWEPLSHIIRNAIDHGMETPSDRRTIGKPEEGVVALKAFHEAGYIVIEASDDGKGIDTGTLKKKAVENGLLTEQDIQVLPDSGALDLIFLPGLSTSETVSETSGRGIGMDVVKSTLKGMKGSVEVESTPGRGTKFTLRLPLTLAVIKALLIGTGDRIYAVPVSAVTEVARVMQSDLTTINGKDSLVLRDRIISIIRLHALFGFPDGGDRKKQFILIVGIGDKKVGLMVERLIGQQEIVIKAVQDQYAGSGLITGASILGDGRVVLILDAPAVVRKAAEEESAKFRVRDRTTMIGDREDRGVARRGILP